jgi:hypothetical protein
MSVFPVVGAIVTVLVIAALFARPAGGKARLYCPNCGTTAQPTRVTKGSMGIELVLWLFFLVPGLIYSIWRLSSRYDACPACKSGGMIPVDSPRARAALRPPQAGT